MNLFLNICVQVKINETGYIMIFVKFMVINCNSVSAFRFTRQIYKDKKLILDMKHVIIFVVKLFFPLAHLR